MLRGLPRQSLWLLALPLLCAPLFAQQTSFELPASAEAIAEITASAPGASWGKSGAEAAVATLYLDGAYNQDLLVFMGEEPWTYRVFLGPVGAGKHTLRMERSARWSAAGAGLSVKETRVRPLGPTDPEFVALTHAPILYARADTLGRFSDAPLLMYYERFPQADGETIQYSVIFTNEDGGTPTDALMARWGRAADIEYVYRVTLDGRGQIRDEVFQAPEHKDLHFGGTRAGQHPFFLVATLNNTFTDYGYSPVQYRLAPVAIELRDSSRELVMDRFPWTYRLVAQELAREGKIRAAGEEKPPAIADPRNYLYLEFNIENRNAGFVAWVKRLNDSRWYSSHHGRLDLSVTRGGWFRTTVELPPGTTSDQLEYIALECLDLRDPRLNPPGPKPEITVHRGGRAFLLDSDYRPGTNLLQIAEPAPLRAGEMISFRPAR